MLCLIASDIDECTDATHNCHSNADCSNTYGGFNCTCFQGYSGDGVTCTGMKVVINILNLHRYSHTQCALIFLIEISGY